MTGNQKFNLVIAYWLGYLLFMVIYFYLATIDEYRNSEKAKAVVIDQLLGAGRGKRGYYPQFQFSYKGNIYTSADELVWVRNKKKGDNLTVIFLKGKPDQAIAYTLISYWVPFYKLVPSFIIAFFLFSLPFLWGQYAAFKTEYKNK